MPNIQAPDKEEISQALPERPALKPPTMYQVLLLNDDFTPVDFVENILVRFFAKDTAQAENITMQVHQQGRGICGVYPKDIAESKALQVESHSRQHHHPLQCVAEKDDT
jgi:ATP-dependent Clp protease adaptor protein ClpS